jgi:eukaryotic-like serine/threonine-protein kinase
MSDIRELSERTLPLPVAQRVNAACNRFELAWKAGQRPDIEDFLEGTDGPERLALINELVALEIDYRRQAQEDPRLEEYQARFPGLDAPEGSANQATRHTGPVPVEAHVPTVPGFELLRELGRGGMGVVYWAWQSGLNRPVALKMIRGWDQAGPEELARFRTEAEAVARVKHPHVIQVDEVGCVSRCPFLAL